MLCSLSIYRRVRVLSFRYFLLCSVTQSYIRVRNIMPNELNDLFIINSVAVVFLLSLLLLLCFEVTIRCVLYTFKGHANF